MSLNFGKVAVLLGGRSAEREVSLRSGAAILNALLRQGVDALAFDPVHDDITQLKKLGFERVFIALHGRGGEDGSIQGFLQTLEIPFTGSDVLSSAIAMDKSKSKQIWQSYQLPTAQYQIIIKDDFNPKHAEDILAALSGEAMVKPVNEGSSIGMAKVSNAGQLVEALSDAFAFDNKVLLESWISGQEYTVSMLNGQVLPAIRMQTDNLFYDYQAKYQSTDTLYFCPCGLESEKLAELNKLAAEAFAAIGCSGWGRVDVMPCKTMWDNLKKVKIGKWISLVFFIALIYALQNSYFKLKDWLTDEKSLPLSSLILTGKLEHVSNDDVRSVLIDQKDRLNFFTLEIAEIQKQLENMPWVYSASIRKRWPDTLKIHIVEQSIIAIWNNRALLNRFGEIIAASPDSVRNKYVALYGDDQFASEVLVTYIKIHQLLKVNHFKIASLTTDKRHSCDIILKNGMKLRLGQEQKLDRIQRFLSVFPLIQNKYDIKTISYVDLRYDTGFAIGWKSEQSKVN